MTLEIIDQYPNKPWNWHSISQNPNLTMEYVEQNLDKNWDWSRIWGNKFLSYKDTVIHQKTREYVAAYQIQQWWNKVITTPIYAVCLRKIKRDYERLFGKENKVLSFRIQRGFDQRSNLSSDSVGAP